MPDPDGSVETDRSLGLTPGRVASGWLPHPTDAAWTYEFSDTVNNTPPSIEHVSVLKTSACKP